MEARQTHEQRLLQLLRASDPRRADKDFVRATIRKYKDKAKLQDGDWRDSMYRDLGGGYYVGPPCWVSTDEDGMRQLAGKAADEEQFTAKRQAKEAKIDAQKSLSPRSLRPLFLSGMATL